MNKAIAAQVRATLMFFARVFALSGPLWWIGSVTDLQLMPGLSVSALMTFCPMVAALLLVRRQNGTTGVRGLLKRSFDFRRINDKLMLFPVNGSRFDLRLGGTVTAGAAAIVVVCWGPRILAGFKLAGRAGRVRLAVALGILGLAIWGALHVVRPCSDSRIPPDRMRSAP